MAGFSNIAKGSFFAVIAFFCMAVFGLSNKAALEHSPVIWVSFIAYLAGALTVAILIAPKGLAFLKSEHYPTLISRALFGWGSSFLYTIAITTIPIVNGTLLNNTAPIFIPILSVLFLKTKLQKFVWIAVAVGFIGIVVIIKPTEKIFTQTGDLIGLLSGFFLAIAYLQTKIMSSTEPSLRIIFYYLGIGTLAQTPLLFFGGDLPKLESCLFSILSGLSLVCAQLALIKGYTYAKASEIGIYQYSCVVFVGLLSWWFWGDVPSFSDLIGIILVAIAGIIIIRNEKDVRSTTKPSVLVSDTPARA